jgi:putative transposase
MADLKRKTDDWIKNYFNTRRRHSTLGYLTQVGGFPQQNTN